MYKPMKDFLRSLTDQDFLVSVSQIDVHNKDLWMKGRYWNALMRHVRYLSRMNYIRTTNVVKECLIWRLHKVSQRSFVRFFTGKINSGFGSYQRKLSEFFDYDENNLNEVTEIVHQYEINHEADEDISHTTPDTILTNLAPPYDENTNVNDEFNLELDIDTIVNNDEEVESTHIRDEVVSVAATLYNNDPIGVRTLYENNQLTYDQACQVCVLIGADVSKIMNFVSNQASPSQPRTYAQVTASTAQEIQRGDLGPYWGQSDLTAHAYHQIRSNGGVIPIPDNVGHYDLDALYGGDEND